MTDLDDYDDDATSGPRSSRGPIILTLGALGIFFGCLPLGAIAWVMARRDLERIRRGEVESSAESLTRAGLIVAIVSTVLGVLVTLALTIEVVVIAVLLTR
jgi:hypothetical protein